MNRYGYGDGYEYDSDTLIRMKNAIIKMTHCQVLDWKTVSDPLNVEGKVDLTLMWDAIIGTAPMNIQIKESSNTKSYNFSVSERALHDYITMDLDIQTLIIAFTHKNKMYFIWWEDFVDYVIENINNIPKYKDKRNKNKSFYVFSIAKITKWVSKNSRKRVESVVY